LESAAFARLRPSVRSRSSPPNKINRLAHPCEGDGLTFWTLVMSKMRGDVCLKTLLKAIPFLLFCLLPQIAFSSEIQGRVPGVCDAEPISVLKNGRAKPVRLHGIDCPEKGQDFGARAKQPASDLCFGKIVMVGRLTDCRDPGNHGLSFPNPLRSGVCSTELHREWEKAVTSYACSCCAEAPQAAMVKQNPVLTLDACYQMC
jgi:hypothetical protein